MDIYTAQYRYSGADRFDVTVKGQDPLGKFFAPTWDMVMGVKNGTMTEAQYSALYAQRVIPAILNTSLIQKVVERFPQSITLVCFCPKGAFCHRYMLAAALAAVPHFGSYKGDR
jgi:hypothetical protein